MNDETKEELGKLKLMMKDETERLHNRIKRFEEENDKLKDKINFMNKRMYQIIQERLKVFLGEEGFKEILFDITKKEIKRNTEGHIKYIVKELLLRMNKKLNAELKISKSLCYSIDTEIKHTIRGLDTSYEMDKTVERILRKSIEGLALDFAKEKLLLK